jgi:hypothetical protein
VGEFGVSLGRLKAMEQEAIKDLRELEIKRHAEELTQYLVFEDVKDFSKADFPEKNFTSPGSSLFNNAEASSSDSESERDQISSRDSPVFFSRSWIAKEPKQTASFADLLFKSPQSQLSASIKNCPADEELGSLFPAAGFPQVQSPSLSSSRHLCRVRIQLPDPSSGASHSCSKQRAELRKSQRSNLSEHEDLERDSQMQTEVQRKTVESRQRRDSASIAIQGRKRAREDSEGERAVGSKRQRLE